MNSKIVKFLILPIAAAAAGCSAVNHTGDDNMNTKFKFVAHRGESMFAPENTAEAYTLAWRNGTAWGAETDVYLTQDGVLVCSHDDSATRTAGIDFNEVNIDVNYKEKKIYITLPNVEIHEINVDMGTLDYIYEKNTSEKDSISQEAYKLCKNDLRERAKNETELLVNANENAKSAIEALIKPWIESVDKEFQIEFK